MPTRIHRPIFVIMKYKYEMGLAGGGRYIRWHLYVDHVRHRTRYCLPAKASFGQFAKESGRYEGQLRYPGEDDTYENPKLDALNL